MPAFRFVPALVRVAIPEDKAEDRFVEGPAVGVFRLAPGRPAEQAGPEPHPQQKVQKAQHQEPAAQSAPPAVPAAAAAVSRGARGEGCDNGQDDERHEHDEVPHQHGDDPDLEEKGEHARRSADEALPEPSQGRPCAVDGAPHAAGEIVEKLAGFRDLQPSGVFVERRFGGLLHLILRKASAGDHVRHGGRTALGLQKGDDLRLHLFQREIIDLRGIRHAAPPG